MYRRTKYVLRSINSLDLYHENDWCMTDYIAGGLTDVKPAKTVDEQI